MAALFPGVWRGWPSLHGAARRPRRHHRAHRVRSGTGLAIGGFDPVAYFTDAAPRLGSPDFELQLRRRGLAVPQRRQPRRLCRRSRGLHAAVRRLRSGRGGAGRQRPRPSPNCGPIAEDRLYLFYSAEARDGLPALPAPRSMPPNGSGPPCCARFRPRFFPPPFPSPRESPNAVRRYLDRESNSGP